MLNRFKGFADNNGAKQPLFALMVVKYRFIICRLLLECLINLSIVFLIKQLALLQDPFLLTLLFRER